MTQAIDPEQPLENWGKPSPASNALMPPYADMPGTHHNEARGAAVCAVWAIVLSMVSMFLVFVASASVSTDQYGNDEATPLLALVAVLGIISVVLWAMAVWKYMAHRSNEYALMVAQVRAQGGLPQHVLDNFHTAPYFDAAQAGSSNESAN